MDFELSDDQLALREGIASLLEGRFSIEDVRALERAADAVDPAAWSALAEAGVFGLLVEESQGGVGFGLAEAAIVFEQLGRVLAPGPLVATTVLAPFLASAADGRPVGLLEEPPRSSAVPALVEHPASIEQLVLLPQLADVAALASVHEASSLDLEPVDAALDPLTPLGRLRSLPAAGTELEGASPAALRQSAMVLAAAMQVGIAARVVELATDYAKGREQFGRPIGGFQAIKHLLADALCRAELARCAVHAAAVTLDDEHVAAAEADTLGISAVQLRWRTVAGAKLLADEAAITNARTAVQVYGGMGFTWEVPVHLYLKRARVLASSLGTRAELADMLASLG
jgi:alkylation response protein AidB-like acyl-CoA dehydrogenase